MTSAQERACALAETATLPSEIDAAHLAMVQAFPRLAEAYPCPCATCREVTHRRALLDGGRRA